MNIALIGATSLLCQDLILSFLRDSDNTLYLFSRNTLTVQSWLNSQKISKQTHNRIHNLDYTTFNTEGQYEVLINFVGVGNPAQAISMGASILEITERYDTLCLNYLKQHPHAKYLFLSSGAAYGSNFKEAITETSQAQFNINATAATDWYGIAKFYAETRHRSLNTLNIIDIRVFNYFSSAIDLSARFFITDLVRALKNRTVFKTSSNNMFRDYLHPEDFYQLVNKIIAAGSLNKAFDCYTKAPIDKMTLLDEIHTQFDLKYECEQDSSSELNATGVKDHYYSLNKAAQALGYQPAKSSLEGLLQEIKVIMA